MTGRMRFGTSGYSYRHWGNSVFYPSGLPQRQWLEFYAERLNSVEINMSFYRLPSLAVFEKWHSTTPNGFVFSVKGSRYITHVKKLVDCREPVTMLMEHAAGLQEKLEVILWQLPHTLREDRARLADFCDLLMAKNRVGLRHVFEFRDSSWFSGATYSTLRKHGIALCIADSSRWPQDEVLTAGFVYLRFHGRMSHRSNYPDDLLFSWASKIEQWLDKGLDVYAYFNNDAHAHAVNNALTLNKLIRRSS